MNTSTHLCLTLTSLGSFLVYGGSEYPGLFFVAVPFGLLLMTVSALNMLHYAVLPRLRIALMARRYWASMLINALVSVFFCFLINESTAQSLVAVHLSLSIAVLIKVLVVFLSERHCFVYRHRGHAIDL